MAVLDSKRAQQDNDPSRSAVLHRHLHHKFLSLARGEGHYLVLDDGRRIFDASGGAAVACVGVSQSFLSISPFPLSSCFLPFALFSVAKFQLLDASEGTRMSC